MLDAWKRVKQGEVRRKKLYPDAKGKMVELAVDKLIENVREFLQHWVGDEVISEDGGEMTHLTEVP